MENDKRNVMDWLNDMAHDEKWPCYYSDSEVRMLAKDALELLKEQVETSIKLYRILDDTCKRVRESTEEDYVCGLCQYDGAYKTDSGDWANECPGFDSSDCFCMKNKIREMCGMELLPEKEE